ncbi:MULTISPECIES: TetR/AcrR family transcriptional regulator [unclassified Corallococcus]|uniref:TetR/AcrR family transcriptional regulator n=1 Tax=unclassified Corallococcus TaxID=2685029 RepID=UPI001A901249|nr:TetR/AcrR family transcriptional regulator [Corallococcus sp. NCRR]MBN9687381.1 TetR/AcrR family transcriptional regulator [Corallococcus sp. NCSPR001]WAS88798.1 helix-turn-helix domain containing protein [Corallococcus sp. NCRR]
MKRNLSPAGDRVWNAARDLFSQQGIRSVGVAEIAERSGVAKPNIYRNFQSKDGLVLAYLRAHADGERALFDAAAAAAPDDPRAQLRFVANAVARLIGLPDYQGCPLVNAAIEFRGTDHPINVAVRRHKGRFLAQLEALATRAQARAPEDLALALLMLFDGASTIACVVDRGRASQMVHDGVDALLERYAPAVPRIARGRGASSRTR